MPHNVGMSTKVTCERCPSPRADHILNGEHLCSGCAVAALTAATLTTKAGTPGLAHELPREKLTIKAPRPHGPQRERRRAIAERRAIGRLKLLHLDEYQAIYAAELHAEGLRPPETTQFDHHLRKLAGIRLLALANRSTRD